MIRTSAGTPGAAHAARIVAQPPGARCPTISSLHTLPTKAPPMPPSLPPRPQNCGYPIQQGASLSRASVHCFKHNDMRDLERIMVAVEAEARKEK